MAYTGTQNAILRWEAAPPMPPLHYSRVIHLSHVIALNMPIWPGDPPVAFDEVARLERDGYTLRRLSIGEHSGTHFNSARTFDPTGRDAAAYPAESLIAPAVVIDIRAQAAASPDYALTVQDILNWERRFRPVAAGELVLVQTGWQNRWARPAEYFGQDAHGLHFPGISRAAAELLCADRGAAGIGIDTHGLDPGQDHSFAANQTALRHDRLVLENLTNLDQLPPLGATVIVGILRLAGGTGSPAAILALVSEHSPG